MKRKRFWSLLLLLSLMLGLLPFGARAADDGRNLDDPWLGALSYRVADDHVMITGCDRQAEGELIVPAEISGLPVTAIDRCAFDYCDKLESIVLPDSVTSIGMNAFSMSSVKRLHLGSGLKTLGQFALANCIELTAIDIPKGVTSLQRGALSRCIKLTDIRLPSTLKSIGMDAFEGCGSLKKLEIPDSVNTIELYAFAFCTSLEEIHLSQNITTLSDALFRDCDSLRTVDIPERVRTVGEDVFLSCDSLESITLPDAVKELSRSLFAACTNLREVHFAPDIVSIGDMCFAGCESLTYISLPDTILSIGTSAFQACTQMEFARLPAKLRTIPVQLFVNCTNLREVVLPPELSVIQWGAFQNCPSLESVYYPGTEDQLAQVTFESSFNDDFLNADFYLIPAMPDRSFGMYDLPEETNWAYEGIAFCLENGFMNGVGGNRFDPYGVTTRAQLVTILWRMSGEPKPTKKLPFTDCGIRWADDAIAWAAENGIVNGTSAKTFSPGDPCTREQLVTIFHRYCREYLAMDVKHAGSLSRFPDAKKVSSWAKDAMAWGTAVKLINGVGTAHGDELQPQGTADRAQIARVIMNFCQNVAPAAP